MLFFLSASLHILTGLRKLNLKILYKSRRIRKLAFVVNAPDVNCLIYDYLIDFGQQRMIFAHYKMLTSWWKI
jgi:hypothetical protein